MERRGQRRLGHQSQRRFPVGRHRHVERPGDDHQVAVVRDVFGTGVQWQFSGGYMVDEFNEARGQFSYQRVGSDLISSAHPAGPNWSRHSTTTRPGASRPDTSTISPGAGIGSARMAEAHSACRSSTRSTAPLRRRRRNHPHRDGLLRRHGRADVWRERRCALRAQRADRCQRAGGFRYNSGLSQIDGLVGTGLEDINDKSARWTMPISIGFGSTSRDIYRRRRDHRDIQRRSEDQEVNRLILEYS